MGILMETISKINRLVEIGCTRVSGYTLVNNYGYRFTKNGKDYDLRCWENCYGVYGGGWCIDSNDGNVHSPYFGDDFEKALAWIQNNL